MAKVKRIKGTKHYAKGGKLGFTTENVLRHYVIAALWSTQNMDNQEEEMLDANYSFEDVDEKTLEAMRKDIGKFIRENEEAIIESGMDEEQLGHDLWLTRKGHGAGFFDRGYDDDVEKKLMDAARDLKGTNLYVGDDGKIHADSVYAKGGDIKNEKVVIEEMSGRFYLYDKAGQNITSDNGFRSYKSANKYATDNDYEVVESFNLKSKRVKGTKHFAKRGEIDNGYTFKVVSVKQHNATASPIMKFYNEGDLGGERKTGYVLNWKHEQGGSGSRFYRTMKELNEGRDKMINRGYAKGGHVSKGELVWGKISNLEKSKFLHENFTPQITPRSQEILVGKAYNFLPKEVKIKFEAKYANVEDYAKGGNVTKTPTGKKWNEFKNDFIESAIGNGSLTEKEAKELFTDFIHLIVKEFEKGEDGYSTWYAHNLQYAVAYLDMHSGITNLIPTTYPDKAKAQEVYGLIIDNKDDNEMLWDSINNVDDIDEPFEIIRNQIEEYNGYTGYWADGEIMIVNPVSIPQLYSKGGKMAKGGNVGGMSDATRKLKEEILEAVGDATDLSTGEVSTGALSIMLDSVLEDVEVGRKMACGGTFEKGGSITSEIQKMKSNLISKAKKNGLYENFGQKEVRVLEDKYGYTSEVASFDNWVMNFDLSQLESFAVGGALKEGFKLFLESWDADIYEDDYEQGEGAHANTIEDKVNKEFDSVDALIAYINKEITFGDTKKEHFDVMEDGRLVTSLLVDNDNSPASKREIEVWKKGDLKLYSANYNFWVKLVKFETPTEEKLSEILGGGTFEKGGDIQRKGTYTGRKVKVPDFKEEVIIGKISGYNGAALPVYDLHEIDVRGHSGKKVGELGNDFIKEYLNPKKHEKGGTLDDSRKAYEEYLNELTPNFEDDQWIIGGKNRNRMYPNYGKAIRLYNRIGFNAGYTDWKMGFKEKGGGVDGGALVTEYASQKDYENGISLKEIAFDDFPKAELYARKAKAKGGKLVVYNIPTKQYFYFGLAEIKLAKGGKVKEVGYDWQDKNWPNEELRTMIEEDIEQHVADMVKEGYTNGELVGEEDPKYNGWWNVEIQEDEDDENDEDIRNEKVADLIREGNTSGYYPTFTFGANVWGYSEEKAKRVKGTKRTKPIETKANVTRTKRVKGTKRGKIK